ncbi:class I SAM-dependent methyltransferase [Solirubrobacter taibaiensis]|nr:class I SAM-dependent methyltransferase [Solirubrobacter taibaiensis]
MSERLRQVVDALDVQPGQRVLEIGCEFIVATLEDADLGDRRFDTIFACRVGLFHREPDRARELAERWLAPGGSIHIAYDSATSRRASAER